MKQVYFQKFGGEYFGDFVFAAYEGFQHMGGSTELKFFEDINKVPVHKDIMVVACIEDTKLYLGKLGVEVPPAMNIPKVLEPMLRRKVTYMTVGEFKASTPCPAFIKPVQLKAFMAGVIQKDSSKNSALYGVPDETPALVSSVIDIANEYRVFVNKGGIVGIKQYGMVNHAGDHFAFPDQDYVERCVIRMNGELDTPFSYTMDVAVLKNGDTELLECNDGWSVGSYGLDGELYAKFLLDRWRELTKFLHLKQRLGNLLP